MNKVNGFVLIDKPAGITSHKVVSIARRVLNEKRIGHAGTLDPFATGLMILGVGRATRLMQYVIGKDKSYIATIRLGASSSTDDLTGELVLRDLKSLSKLTEKEIRDSLNSFQGKIMQRPSSISAIQINGQRAYDLVRSGQEVELKERAVEIYYLKTLQIKFSTDHIDIEIEVKVSSGTYIRAIARDLGEKLGVGGHLISLRRVTIGNQSIEQAVKINENSSFDIQITSITDMLTDTFPLRTLDEKEEKDISHGRSITPNIEGKITLAINSKRESLALIENQENVGKPILVLVGE